MSNAPRTVFPALCPGRIGPSVREAEYLWTTVAYVLWPSGARRLLEELPGVGDGAGSAAAGIVA